MLFLPRFAHLIFSLFVLMPLSFTPATAYDQSPEILGLKLGMSPTDAENTIRAQRPDLTIKIDKQFFTYTDGEDTFQTPEFVARIIAYKGTVSRIKPQEGEEIIMLFSHEVETPHLMVVKRTQQQISEPVGIETFKTTLSQKYGLPTSTEKSGRRAVSMTWDFGSGKRICYQDDANIVTKSTDWDNFIRIPKGLSPLECAAQLVYKISGDPVKEINAIMVDVEKIVESEKRAQEYIIGLEGKARQKRGSKGVISPL
ncbi:MAG: hypothetical protein WC043_04685 [Pseudobdellovibrionaceae bacterium]